VMSELIDENRLARGGFLLRSENEHGRTRQFTSW